MPEHREDHADRHGFGGPDELDVRTLARGGTADGTKFLRDDGTWQTASGGGGGDSLWEEVLGDLRPIAEPATSFDVTVGNSNVYMDTNDLILSSTDGTYPIDIDLNGSTGDINVWCNNDWNIGPHFGTTNQDMNVEFGRDYNIIFGNDWNANIGRDINFSAGQDGGILAAQDAYIGGNRDTVIGRAGTDQVNIRTTASAPTDARMLTGSVVVFLDETNNVLKIRVRESGGSYFTAEVPYF